MLGKIFTSETRIEITNELRTYLNNFVCEYNKVYRIMYQIMRKPDFYKQYSKNSYFVSEMCNKYGLLKRTVNSIFKDIQGKMKALEELKKTQLRSIENKIEKQKNRIDKVKKELDKIKQEVVNNTLTEKQLEKYRKQKQGLYYKLNRLNKLKQRKEQLEYEINNKVLKIGFGGKKTFDKQYRLEKNKFKTHNQWYKDYIKKRDKNIVYIGSRDETNGNTMFQMQVIGNKFKCKLRKDGKQVKNNESKYIEFYVDFTYLRDEIIKIINGYKDKNAIHKPLTYRFKRRNNKWYLQVMFEIERDTITNTMYGSIGLDYNNGFIELAETDKKGNLIHQQHYQLKHHGIGNKAKSEIQEMICKITDYALSVGKDIVIEDLNFKKKKSQVGKNKEYNKMIHKFDYSRYKECFERSCFRKEVGLIKINPYNTSKIGKQKYSNRMKLNIHQSASYVIARKGQGYIDKLVA